MNASPERQDSQLTGYPRSAPMKGDGEDKASYGLSIPYISQDEEHSKKKKMQNLAYYQELTRQIQEKNRKKPQQNSEILPENQLEKPARYSKKHEIENHTNLAKYNELLFGGVLQRDEAALNKIKKQEQQREMQSFLLSQIQEKNTRKEREKLITEKVFEELKIEPASAGLAAKTSEKPEEFDRKIAKSKTGIAEEQSLSGLKASSEQLSKEKDELVEGYKKNFQYKEITEINKGNKDLVDQSCFTPGKYQKKNREAHSNRVNYSRESYGKSPIMLRGIQIAKYSKECSNQTTTQPKTPETELESVRLAKDSENSRHNLDTAGKSCFIYPDSQGNFADEIDKFLVDFKRKEGTMYRSALSSAEQAKGGGNSTGFSSRKSEKPLMAYRGVFPTDFFRHSRLK